MSKKKYLMTAGDLLEYGLAVTNQLGLSCIETLEFIDKFLAEHEYHERTCHVTELKTGEPANYEDTDEVIFHCESCHAERGVFSYDDDGNVYSERPDYCPHCGAEVIDGDR